jgi:L-threonylcarbamoyladenylate synthase
MSTNTTNWDEAAGLLGAGGIGVIPTDTLYGVVGSATSPRVVERIYDLRRRERDKPLIVLIEKAADLAKFQIAVSKRTQELFDKVWPGPVSIIVAVPAPELAYLHRGTMSLAFRVPAKSSLRKLLHEAGPLVAPSANLAGMTPAVSVDEAQKYFGDQVFYVDEGPQTAPASALVDARSDPPKILRTAPGFGLQ